MQVQNKLRLGQHLRVVGFQSRPELMVREDQFMNGIDKLLIEDHLEATVNTEESRASFIAGAGKKMCQAVPSRAGPSRAAELAHPGLQGSSSETPKRSR